MAVESLWDHLVLRSKRLPSDPSGFKVEVIDITAQLKLPGSGALDLEFIGGTLLLEFWDPRPFARRRKHDDLPCCQLTIFELEFGSRAGERWNGDHRLPGGFGYVGKLAQA